MSYCPHCPHCSNLAQSDVDLAGLRYYGWDTDGSSIPMSDVRVPGPLSRRPDTSEQPRAAPEQTITLVPQARLYVSAMTHPAFNNESYNHSSTIRTVEPAHIPPPVAPSRSVDSYFVTPVDEDDYEGDAEGDYEDVLDDDEGAYVIGDGDEAVFVIDDDDEQAFCDGDVYEDEEDYYLDEEPTYLCKCGCQGRFYEDEVREMSPMEASRMVYAPSSAILYPPSPVVESMLPPHAPYLAPAPFPAPDEEADDDKIHGFWDRLYDVPDKIFVEPPSIPSDQLNSFVWQGVVDYAMRASGRRPIREARNSTNVTAES